MPEQKFGFEGDWVTPVPKKIVIPFLSADPQETCDSCCRNDINILFVGNVSSNICKEYIQSEP